ncbi:MAG: glutamine amidotransferase [Coriobacteriia bacterium]|nr:glutamine amidotransferase [Coriobacteriia bacterium]
MNIRIAHLYPDLLNLYGDRGNITCLQKRCSWRGIEATVHEYRLGDELPLDETDILFLGGGSDREQCIVSEHLQGHRDAIQSYVESDGVLVAVCGGYQLLGHSYQQAGETIAGLSIIDSYTIAGERRLIGNVVMRCQHQQLVSAPSSATSVVGFENHAGRTYLGPAHTPLGVVTQGYGNNGEDGGEGVLYRNVIGTYLHGPLFPKNPLLADFVIRSALQRKYSSSIALSPLDDSVEHRAHDYLTRCRLARCQ